MPEKKKKAPTTVTWVRPSGSEIATNTRPATIAAAEALKWKRKEEIKK